MRGKLHVAAVLALLSFGLLIGGNRTRPAQGEASEDNHAQAAARAVQTADTLGEGYRARIDRKRRLVFVSALDDKHLRKVISLVLAYTDAQAATLLDVKEQPYITVILPTPEDYRTLAGKKLLQQKAVGFYRAQDCTLISLDRGRILIHEFTHALHAADMAAARQVHPVWVSEGLATLFEASVIRRTGLEPFVDLRLIALKRAIRKDQFIPLEKLLTLEHDAFMEQAEIAYPQCRYLMLYLHQKGKLKEFYALLKKRCHVDPTGRRALQEALGEKTFQIEPRWIKWVNSLELPRRERSAGEGRLGIKVRNTPEGVEVVELLEDGAARRAGRIEVGDILLKVNGRSVANSVALFAAVKSAGALRTITIELKRRGQVLTIRQALGAPEEVTAAESSSQ
ncbi:MAG: PDZ domain-containing protein [Phycisphaerae bacterium]